MLEDKQKEAEKQEQARQVEQQLVRLLWPMLVALKRRLDRRLVETFLGLVMAIIKHRHRNNGLLLSELGGYLLDTEHCRAGTKRISNLVHSERWSAGVIEEFLWQAGTQRVEELWAQGERPLVIWDESVLEKPESLQAEGLCAVRSSASSLVFSTHRVGVRSLCQVFIGSRSWFSGREGLPRWRICVGGPRGESRRARNGQRKA